MLWFVVPSLSLFVLCLLYSSKIHLVYTRLRGVNSLVSIDTNGLSLVVVACESLFLYIKSILTHQGLVNPCSASIKPLEKDTYELTYTIRGKEYKAVIRPRRGPVPIVQVTNDREEDITGKVLGYMGPEYNWHGNRVTPGFFGYESMTIELFDGTLVSYQANDVIPLDLQE